MWSGNGRSILIDLSMHDAYPDILGYTQDELERFFHEYIEWLV